MEQNQNSNTGIKKGGGEKKVKTTKEGGGKTDKTTKLKQKTGGRGWGRVVTSGGAKEGVSNYKRREKQEHKLII